MQRLYNEGMIIIKKNAFNQSVLDIFKQECSVPSFMQRYNPSETLMKRLMLFNLFLGSSGFSDQGAIVWEHCIPVFAKTRDLFL